MKEEQNEAAEKLLHHSDGILNAATAFGKTIVCSKNTLTGIVDVAMVGSMYSKGKYQDMLNLYGMVIMDECHHAASKTSIQLLQKINAKYVYGVSATPKRGDHLDRIIYMLLGPQRHKFTALDRAKQ